ncbi:hypothetical protein HAX54_050348 [Datura stramonium]|uniref:Uncharacterized protein n=1 Tax=Datura stramonium TaxID=4076 RepID=A0ABS8SWZ6_DATST|nr:hypothetical protein [Datura stramonium]
MEKLRYQQRDFLLRPPRRYCQTPVEEFYASYGGTLNDIITGLRSQVEPLDSILVRGVPVDINFEEINQYYFGDDFASVDTKSYEKKANARDNPNPWMATLIDKAPKDPLVEDIGVELQAENAVGPFASLLDLPPRASPIIVALARFSFPITSPPKGLTLLRNPGKMQLEEENG